jgi:hypothetical protein
MPISSQESTILQLLELSESISTPLEPSLDMPPTSLRPRATLLLTDSRCLASRELLSLIYYSCCTTFLSSIGYSLPVTSMTTVELQQSQTMTNQVILNKLGYNKNYPQAVALFAPTQEFGVGLHDMIWIERKNIIYGVFRLLSCNFGQGDK